jgi:hypothetical protein
MSAVDVIFVQTTRLRLDFNYGLAVPLFSFIIAG